MSATPDPGSEAFGLRVREALAKPEGSRLGALFTAPFVTALVVDGEETFSDPRLTLALVEVRDALERVGVPRGRQFVLLGGAARSMAEGMRDRLPRLSRQLSLPVLAHDPARSFEAGRVSRSEPVELDDELREAEAIVCIGRGFATMGRVSGGPFLLVPGAASLATRQALETRRAESGERGALAFALAAEEHAPVDMALAWDASGDRVRAGRGRTLFAALAREAGLD